MRTVGCVRAENDGQPLRILLEAGGAEDAAEGPLAAAQRADEHAPRALHHRALAPRRDPGRAAAERATAPAMCGRAGGTDSAAASRRRGAGSRARGSPRATCGPPPSRRAAACGASPAGPPAGPGASADEDLGPGLGGVAERSAGSIGEAVGVLVEVARQRARPAWAPREHAASSCLGAVEPRRETQRLLARPEAARRAISARAARRSNSESDARTLPRREASSPVTSRYQRGWCRRAHVRVTVPRVIERKVPGSAGGAQVDVEDERRPRSRMNVKSWIRYASSRHQPRERAREPHHQAREKQAERAERRRPRSRASGRRCTCPCVGSSLLVAHVPEERAVRTSPFSQGSTRMSADPVEELHERRDEERDAAQGWTTRQTDSPPKRCAIQPKSGVQIGIPVSVETKNVTATVQCTSAGEEPVPDDLVADDDVFASAGDDDRGVHRARGAAVLIVVPPFGPSSARPREGWRPGVGDP